MAMSQEKRRTGKLNGVSNVTYDVMTMLQSKLEALEAYEIYRRDAQEAGDREVEEALTQISQHDAQHAQRLKDLLKQRLS
jgi:rubrerythrin